MRTISPIESVRVPPSDPVTVKEKIATLPVVVMRLEFRFEDWQEGPAQMRAPMTEHGLRFMAQLMDLAAAEVVATVAELMVAPETTGVN